jgi:hypothetical protein
MATIHEIKQTLWVDTPHGIGQALFLIDYGIHQNTIWVVCLKHNGKILHYDSNQLTIDKNNTLEINTLSNDSNEEDLTWEELWNLFNEECKDLDMQYIHWLETYFKVPKRKGIRA